MAKDWARFAQPVDEKVSATPEDLLQQAVRLHQSGQFAAAASLYQKIIERDPQQIQAHLLLGIVAFQTGNYEAAEWVTKQALALDPCCADAHNNLGLIYRQTGDLQEAVACFKKALQFNAELADAHSNLAMALQDLGAGPVGGTDSLGEAQQAVKLNPHLPEARNNLGVEYQMLGLVEKAIDEYREALRLRPNFATAHSNLLLCQQYSSEISSEDLFVEAQAWGSRHAPASLQLPQVSGIRGDKIRLGYVSADFRFHASADWLEAVLSCHDKSRFEVFLYSNYPTADGVTQRLRSHADGWREIFSLSDDEAALLVRSDAIDVLIDLSGHTGHNRLGLFARKPAPVQASWMGYLGTTGMSQMDAIIADGQLISASDEAFFSERVWRMPNIAYCYAPPADAPEVSLLPALTNDFITFGCFNAALKLSRPVISAWSDILHETPNSRLILKAGGMDDARTHNRFLQWFADDGIDSGRLTLEGKSTYKEYLSAFSRVDISLDPFPYNGGTTTAGGLWMGVPVVTLRGDRMAGRAGATMLTALGLEGWIAQTVEEYVGIASAAAADLDFLAETRASLRERVSQSPMCDAETFTRDFEDLITRMSGPSQETELAASV